MEAMKERMAERAWSGYRDIESYCGLSRWTIFRAAQDGQLRISKVGRRVLVNRDDLDEYLGRRGLGTR